MAVPRSGEISMIALAQERLYGTYGDGRVSGQISLSDLVDGGNQGGSGESYPELNTESRELPNTSGPKSFSSWRQYIQRE